MARRPKGSYSRSTPDWFSGSMAWIGMASGSTGGTYPGAGLYNDSTLGLNLHVVGLEVGAGAGTTSINVVFTQGPPGYNVGTPGQPVLLNKPAPPGAAIYTNGSALFAGPHAVFWYGADPVVLMPGWPLWIVPPGYTMWLQSNAQNVYLGATAWYLPIGD